jgi:hypothetical protein
VIRGIVEGSKGTTREIAVVLSKEGKVLSRTEVEALRKCGAAKAPEGPLLLTARPKLTQSSLEHIVLRHWPTSGAKGAGKFDADVTARNLRGMIEEAAARGTWTPDRFGRSRIEFDFGRQIGVDMACNPTSRIRIIVEPNLDVVTAFPIP